MAKVTLTSITEKSGDFIAADTIDLNVKDGRFGVLTITLRIKLLARGRGESREIRIAGTTWSPLSRVTLSDQVVTIAPDRISRLSVLECKLLLSTRLSTTSDLLRSCLN